jgi:hypothetical protein
MGWRVVVVRGEWHAVPSGVNNDGLSRWRPLPQCSKFKALVLNLFSHYLLLDRKNEVYDDHGSGGLRR